MKMTGLSDNEIKKLKGSRIGMGQRYKHKELWMQGYEGIRDAGDMIRTI